MILFDKPENICSEHNQPFWRCPKCGNRGCTLGINEKKCANYAFNQGTCLRCNTHVPSYNSRSEAIKEIKKAVCKQHHREFLSCPKCGNKGCNVGKAEQKCPDYAFEEGFCLKCKTHIPTYREH